MCDQRRETHDQRQEMMGRRMISPSPEVITAGFSVCFVAHAGHASVTGADEARSTAHLCARQRDDEICIKREHMS